MLFVEMEDTFLRDRLRENKKKLKLLKDQQVTKKRDNAKRQREKHIKKNQANVKQLRRAPHQPGNTS